MDSGSTRELQKVSTLSYCIYLFDICIFFLHFLLKVAKPGLDLVADSGADDDRFKFKQWKGKYEILTKCILNGLSNIVDHQINRK